MGLIVEGFAFFAGVRDAVEIVFVEIGARDEIRHRAHVSTEERFEVNREIANYRQVSQRFNLQFGADGFDYGAAGKAFFAVDDHSARTAHPDTTGKAKGKVWNRATLQGKECVEDAGAVADLDFVPIEGGGFPCFAGTLDRNGNFWHGGMVANDASDWLVFLESARDPDLEITDAQRNP